MQKFWGVFFHFKQALLKKIKKLGIEPNEASLAMQPGCLDVLSIIPHEEVKSIGITYVKSLLPSNEKWNKFWVYFEKTWLGRYEIEDWNVSGSKPEDIRNRTNNALERFNRTLNTDFPNAHPNLLNFAETIRKRSFETLKTLNLIRLEKEKPPPHSQSVSINIPVQYNKFKKFFLKNAASCASSESSDIEPEFESSVSAFKEDDIIFSEFMVDNQSKWFKGIVIKVCKTVVKCKFVDGQTFSMKPNELLFKPPSDSIVVTSKNTEIVNK